MRVMLSKKIFSIEIVTTNLKADAIQYYCRSIATTENSQVPIIKSPRIKQLWRPFPCHTCGKSYTRKDTLRRHLRYECGKNPQYICYVCKKGFKQKSNFQRHNINVHGGRSRGSCYPVSLSRVIVHQNPYPCHKCGRSYRNKGSLKRHLHDECGKPPQYICSICEKGFKQKANFQRHNATIHDYRGGLNSNRQSSRSIGFLKPYPCYKCTRSYTNKSTLNRHLREECGKLPQYIYGKNIFMTINKEPYECKDSVEWNINSTWSIPVEAKKPRKKYKKKRFMSLELPVLTDYSRNLSELLEISKKKDDPVDFNMDLLLSKDYYKRLGRHLCRNCGKEYRWMQSLVRHEKEECGKAPQHSCPLCGMKIRHKWMLKKHISSDFQRQITTNDILANISAVHVAGVTNGDHHLYVILKRVVRKCSQGRAHICDSCGRTYKWKESLRQHQRLECGIQPQFGCHLCGRRFQLVATAVFPCRRCGRIFLNKKTMWNHLTICGKEPQYPCESCGKRFRQKHHLTKHLKSSVHKAGNLINATECKDNKNWFYE
ncbi:hypothetical protein PV326_001076 [Microctonus aethiopoides]|nr:hypothetical protein PV326_001076 [Microctonus aethiopoides]